MLSSDGVITMLYKDSPIPLLDSQELLQPSLQFTSFKKSREVKLSKGLTDVLELSKAIPTNKIIETVALADLNKIIDGTIVEFTPLQTCLDLVTCEECVNFQGPIQCFWKYGQCQAQEFLLQETKSCQRDKPFMNFTKEMLFENKKTYYSFRIYKSSGSQWRHLFDNRQIDNLERVFGRRLKFQFPFYGHYIQHVVMLKEGTLSLGGLKHDNLLETQTISAMTADFQTDEKSLMLSDDDGQVATFIWKDFRVKGLRFTFQINLFHDGRIEIVYKSAPLMPLLFDDLLHPVKVGLSDGYLIERRNGLINHEELVKYHELDLTHKVARYLLNKAHSEVVIAFKPLKTCNQYKSCWECTTHNTDFNCVWCPELQACSDNGIDRRYQVVNVDFLNSKIPN